MFNYNSNYKSKYNSNYSLIMAKHGRRPISLIMAKHRWNRYTDGPPVMLRHGRRPISLIMSIFIYVFIYKNGDR